LGPFGDCSMIRAFTLFSKKEKKNEKQIEKGNNMYPINVKLQIHFSALSFSRIYRSLIQQ
jgi:hypothetical protein